MMSKGEHGSNRSSVSIRDQGNGPSLILVKVQMLTLDRKEKDTALPSFVQHAIESELLSDEECYALKFCAGAMYGGGVRYCGFFPHDDHPSRNST